MPLSFAPVEIVRDWRGLPERLRGAAIAMGAFDGVHLGHQAVIADAARAACDLGAPLAVLSFDPAPKVYFNPDGPSERLMDAVQFEAALGALGVARIYLLPMKALSTLTSAEFAQGVLRDGLGARHVAVGFDNTFGCDRAGPEAMARYGATLGFATSVAAEVADETGAKICSTAVRQALRRGAPEAARRALGRAFAVRGPASGEEAGTYSLTLAGYVAPRSGAYAVRAHLADGGQRLGQARIADGAMRVRLDGDAGGSVVETELLDYVGG